MMKKYRPINDSQASTRRTFLKSTGIAAASLSLAGSSAIAVNTAPKKIPQF